MRPLHSAQGQGILRSRRVHRFPVGAPRKRPRALDPDRARLKSIAREPYVLGYVFGAAAAAVERHGISRESGAANSIIVTLIQIVLGGESFDECVAINQAATESSNHAAGVCDAAMDGMLFQPDRPGDLSLYRWLASKLGKPRGKNARK